MGKGGDNSAMLGIKIEKGSKKAEKDVTNMMTRFAEPYAEEIEKTDDVKDYKAEEVYAHSNWLKKDSWLVYHGKVYDFSRFRKKHPGGNVIVLYSGQEATTVMDLMHKDHDKLKRWLKPLYIGECSDLKKQDALSADFYALTEELRQEGMFKANLWWFMGLFAHIMVIEIGAVLYIANGGVEWGGWIGYMTLAVALCCSQIQAGWLQHDFGHLSVFDSWHLNYFFQQFTMCHMKSASRHWWNSRHGRHHAKTNIVKRDPDPDATLPLFLFGEAYFDAGRYYFRKLIPYQTVTWWFFGPPTVATIVFVVQTIWIVIQKRKYYDMFFMYTAYLRIKYTYYPYLGFSGCMKLYFAVRFIESHWFTWITSLSHLPKNMLKDKDAPKDWVRLQLGGTQNILGGTFIEWVMGHLNWQIEHHLWPTMPRHNFKAVSPRVKALCAKHGVEYTERTFWQGCCDVINKLDSVAHSYEDWIAMKRKGD